MCAGRTRFHPVDHPAQQIVLQDYIHAVQNAEARLDRLTRQIEELLPGWSMAPVVTALQAMRGVALVVAVTVVAEVGDFRRFANARQLMAYLGLVPSEHSSGAAPPPRNRWFADSSLEGNGFELLVPRHESWRFPKDRAGYARRRTKFA